MTTYDNTNRGSLRKNAAKQEDRQPDYKGSIDIEGKQFWLSGWSFSSARSRATAIRHPAKSLT
jgi:hypothetical protein